MYKGKFEQKSSPAAPAAAKAPTSEQQNAPREASESRPLPQRRTPPRRRPPAQRSTGSHRQSASQRNRRKRTTKGTYIFYGVYAAFILVFFIAVFIAMGALKNWLVDLQAAQPGDASQKIFDTYFVDPDWAEIYALAYPDDSSADGKAAYAAYMQDTVGDKKLSFSEDTAGLNGDRKYIVYYMEDAGNGIAIGTYTLTANNKDAKVPDWKLGTMKVFFSRNLSYDIVTLPGCTVTVNGKVLDETHIIRTVSTAAEEYLPTGFHGYQLLTYRVSGLMSAPEVAVTDAAGQSVEVTFDKAKSTYTQVMPESPSISNDEYKVVLSAAKAYSEFMIAGSYDLTKYFDTKSEIYKTITGGMIIRQKYASYKFLEETISDYYQYSDDLFSAKINLVTEVTRKDGTVKEFEVDSTFIFDKSSGKWMVHDMVNLNIQEQITQVRLTFKDAEGKEIRSEFVNADTRGLTTPTITAPEGKVFVGWYEETTDAQGNIELTPRFTPDANGNVTVVETLEPMVLVPQFKEAQ